MLALRFRRLPAAALMALAACTDASAPAASPRLSLAVGGTDPGAITEAVVTVTEIDLVGDSGVVVLRNTPVTADLLSLADSTASWVQDAVIPSGAYHQLRFVISGGYVSVDNGDGTTSLYASAADYAGLPAGATVTGDLQMPSYGQSGLKVTLSGGPLTFTEGDVLLGAEFDIAQSFGARAGQSGKWVMHPVVQAGMASVGPPMP